MVIADFLQSYRYEAVKSTKLLFFASKSSRFRESTSLPEMAWSGIEDANYCVDRTPNAKLRWPNTRVKNKGSEPEGSPRFSSFAPSGHGL
jgi:hypothetical protein